MAHYSIGANTIYILELVLKLGHEGARQKRDEKHGDLAAFSRQPYRVPTNEDEAEDES